MLPFSPERSAHALGARIVLTGKARSFSAVGTDTRSLASGAIFVAIQGQVPGERYFGAALQAGAGALVGRSFTAAQRRAAGRRGVWLLQVKDGLAALQALAADQRRLLSCPVIAITGSNGKTGAKDLLAWLLASEGKTLATRGNFNNHLGVPLTLLRAEPGLRFAVLEAGMNHAGELSALGRLLKPDMALELNVGDAHLGHFGSRAAVGRAKEELLQAMGPAGIAVVNADDPLTRAMGARFGGRTLSFGRSAAADLRLEKIVDRGARGLSASAVWKAPLGGRPCRLRVQLAQGGRAGWTQAAAALCAGLGLGLEPQQLALRLAAWLPSAKLRQELRPLPFGATAIVDAYNASPQSMQAGLEFLGASAAREPRLAVLGCMLELGSAAKGLHRELGRQARLAGVRSLAALGEQADEIVKGFGREAAAFGKDQAEEAAAWMKPRLTPGSWVLFKGSRGLAVERVYDALQGAAS